MSSTSFTPYWRHIREPTEPYSWVFFVVAKIAGHHRPVAIVSSPGISSDEETIRGSPLVAACHRIITIFRNKTAHVPSRTDRATGNNNSSSNSPKEGLDHTVVREFPFISASLLQGVAFDAVEGLTLNAYPEPLGTVYRDTLIGWGMVVIDITDLD
ncbi:hypothetical protein DL95DRAFT_459922 [Leptodontidium sp. 2 PMI_412]|nr:hypothetical protein DL95DRAFT_459922 [Leptodontidium sp. 2 PMI_412]